MSNDFDIFTQQETREVNQVMFERLSSTDPTMVKSAVDTVNDFTRTKMREDGFFRKILPPQTITNDELDRQTHTDKPIKIIDKEPDSPAAVSVPFATLPTNIYIRGPRYAVAFQRIQSPRFTKDTDELRTWTMDIRQVLSDNAIKDMLAEEDGKWIVASNTCMVSQGATVATSGTVQWEAMGGSISRESLADMLKIMPSTPSHFEVKTCLINNITAKDLMKFGRTEMGGDLSQEVMEKGWTLQEFAGVSWIITIKTDIVPDGACFMYCDPKGLGKHLMLEDVTMFIRREAFLLEFFSYELTGATIGNSNGVARADFTT